MAGKNQIEASQLAPLNERLDELEKQEAEQQQSQTPAAAPPDLSRLQEMGREDLIALIKALPAKITGYALQTKEEREEALLLKLITLALDREDAKDVVSTAKEYFDRVRGKPMGFMPNISIGAGGGDKKIQIVFMSPEDVRREREIKAIDVTPK